MNTAGNDKTVKIPKWHRDNMGDYVIEIESEKSSTVRGRIVRCPITSKVHDRFWRTKTRWLLMVNNHFYGFWNTVKESIDKFEKDCVPKEKPVDLDPDNIDPEYYCWHGDKPFGPGPYCTSCGGLIKPRTV